MALLGVLVWAAWRLRITQVRSQFALLLGERVRLSREIHDTLLQSLVGVSLQLDQLGSDLEAAPTASRAQVTRIRKQVEEYIREARQSIWNLRSSTLQRHDLAAALRQSGERAAESAVAFDFTVTGTPHRCAPAVEEQVLRIGQEAVTNVLRHSGAQRIRMELKYETDAVTLRVADDGCGFDPSAVGSSKAPEGGTSHWGVMSMRERAETIGGIFRISSVAGAGTIVETVVPVGQA
jgi:signal transduction histidine kinase